MMIIRCGIRENAKHFDEKRDLTATREAGFTKTWVRDARFFPCLSEIRITTHVYVLAASMNKPGECSVVSIIDCLTENVSLK